VNISKRFSIALRVIALSISSALIISSNVWVSTDRTFPEVPVFFQLPQSTSFLLYILLFFSCLLLFRYQKAGAGLFICAYLILLVGDLTRGQPWCYQYLLMFLCIFFILPSGKKECCVKDIQQILVLWQLITSGIYFWSGIHKINIYFVLETFPWMTQIFLKNYPGSFTLLFLSGMLAPFIEAGAGVGLLFSKTKNISILLLILMHGFILFFIGPLGLQWNQVVWPWNITMMLLLPIIFYEKNRDIVSIFSFARERRVIFYTILLLSFCMPFLSFYRVWPAYFSWALYSNDTYDALIAVPQKESEIIPEALKKFAKEEFQNGQPIYTLSINEWSINTLGVPVPPELYIYKKAQELFCKSIKGKTNIVFIISRIDSRFTRRKSLAIWKCAEEN
jgi:hypothetical protein